LESAKVKDDGAKADEPHDGKGARSEAGQPAAPQGRQIVVPVPSELTARQSRSRAEAPPGPGGVSRKAVATQSAAPPQGAEKARGDKAPADSEQAERPPALVRLLIVIEPAEATPAAQPPAGKSPGGA
jgi:hypothetical protein